MSVVGTLDVIQQAPDCCWFIILKVALMSNLQAVQQNGRALVGIPDWVLQTSSLTRLSLRKNQIALLSREISQLPLLKYLDFSENQWVALPPEIGLLTELQSVLLAFNHLCVLPRTLSLCVNIESLDLKGNKLTNVPFFFTRFVRLSRLDYTNNALQVTSGLFGFANVVFFRSALSELMRVFRRESLNLQKLMLTIHSTHCGI